MKKFIFALTVIVASALCGSFCTNAQPAGDWDSTQVFAVRDSQTLALDFYFPGHWQQSDTLRPCMIFVYGGGFVENNQRSRFYTKFCRAMADNGYVTIASDYRLGLKDFHGGSILKMMEPVRNSIHMAAEDLFAALDYVIRNAERLRIDTSKIVICGSSAG